MKYYTHPALLICLMSVANCTSFASARVNDFRDMLTISVGVGAGLTSQVCINDGYGFGLGIVSKSWNCGITQRRIKPYYSLERLNTFPFLFVASTFFISEGISDIQRGKLTTYSIGLALPIIDEYYGTNQEVPKFRRIFSPFGNICMEDDDIIRLDKHRFNGIDAGVFIGVVGVDVGFSPIEFADFLLGWFGVDFMNDDKPIEVPETDVGAGHDTKDTDAQIGAGNGEEK